MVGFRNLSLVQNGRKSESASSTSLFCKFSCETLPKMPGHKKIPHLPRSKITFCFQHILVVVYMWMFGASPVAWTKSRLEWNASEKKPCAESLEASPPIKPQRKDWMAIYENHWNHEIPKQAISSLKHGFLTKKTGESFSYRDLLQGFNWISTLFIHEDLYPHLQGLSWESKGTLPPPTGNNACLRDS